MADLGDDTDGFERTAPVRRPSVAPTTPPRRPSFARTAPAPYSVRKPAPESQAPIASSFDGEDFLFHLYRGSELLQDNCVSQAKEELELALHVQPQDIEAQGLLGLAYFRLGLYPRAIEIYQELIRVCPAEVSPRVNLALCFMRTGHSRLARDNLEDVTTRVPEHVRAWGYLGLVHERLADYDEARMAFERALQPRWARRMQQLIDEQSACARARGYPPERARVQRVQAAAAVAVQELKTDETGFLRAITQAETGAAISDPAELCRSSAPSANAFASNRVRSADPKREPPIVGPAGRSALLDVADSLAVRSDAVRGLRARGAAFSNTPLTRRVRGRQLSEPLGGPGSPWVQLEGVGQVLVGASPARELSKLELSDTFIYVRESCLVAFAGGARYESGRLPSGASEPIAMVQLTGRGALLIESRKAPQLLNVAENQKLAVRAADVVGWVGRLLGHPLEPESAPSKTPGFVAFSGSGSVLVDLG